MFRLFSRPKDKWRADSPYPLSLGAEQLKALKEFRDSDAHEAFQQLIHRMAELRAVKLMGPATVEQHNFDRGALYAFAEVYDVVNRLVTKMEEIADHESKRRRNGDQYDDGRGDGPLGRLWGSPNFTDEWRQ